MTRGEDEDKSDPPLPRETTVLFGHDSAEREFLAVYRSGRVPHAWLIGGEPGIGKATLAYRIARFVLAQPDPSRGSTAGEGGWRVCIVDSADELKYPEGSNALLKMLEEPPPRSLFLLVSHAAGRLLPTFRSRCRRLALRPLGQGDVARAASTALGANADDPAVAAAAAAARGSVSQAIALAGGPMLALREKVAELLSALPSTDPRALHALGDELDRDRGLLDVFVGAVRDWLSGRLDTEVGNLTRLARTADLWERLNRSARDVEVYNLERKPFVFTIFGLLAEASRG